MTVLDTLFLLGFLIAAVWVLWESSLMIDERNKLRHYTGKYYDFDINQALKAMGKTRSQALSEIDNSKNVFDKSKVKYCDGDNT
jgi:hypothetical protein